jgi:CO/xanthine dehydrogenase FAD-binding subunit
MKAAPFDFARARSVEEACALLAAHGGDAKLIAGGQSLVPMMAMRLARPAFLVDINDAADLQVVVDAGTAITIGAAVRQRSIERDAALARRLPLLRKALAWVGHAQTRNRGTIGGSIVHADPSAELPLAACLLDATLVLRDSAGVQELPAREFMLAPMVTAIAPEQCLAAIRFPVWSEARTGCAFDEVSLRKGDFALVGAAAQVALDAQGKCVRAALGTSSAPIPQAHTEIAQRLVGTTLDDAAIADVAAAVARAVEPDADLHASAEYRRHLAGVLAKRVLVAARDDARRRP